MAPAWLLPGRGYVTMPPVEEKPVSSKYAKTPRREPTGGDGRRQKREPDRDDAPRKDDEADRPHTEPRARELAERHRETLDHLGR